MSDARSRVRCQFPRVNMTNSQPAGAFQTEQEKFWHGEFGSEYTERNTTDQYVHENSVFFKKMFALAGGNPGSVLELGSNSGVNLRGISAIDANIALSAVEINPHAAEVLKSHLPKAEVFQQSLLDFKTDKRWDLVFCKGVLIHINPEHLSQAYETLYRHSAKYVLVAEYYNISPMEMSYRGHTGKLYKRDFCGEIMAKYPDLTLIDYGFIYHRDAFYKNYDDVTWFLMRKGG